MKNKARCKNCGDVIESLRGGHWISCKCFTESKGTTGIYIDTTRRQPHLHRGGGHPEHFERLKFERN